MSDKSDIQWTDATWNPTTGCTKLSPGCANCYIERTPPFRIHGRKFVKGEIPLIVHEDRLTTPTKWKAQRRVFVNSLSDLFHADVPEQTLHDVYYTMEQRAPQHVYQILTKRPQRMRTYLDWRYGDGRLPSRHIWHGVSVENERWTSRLDDLAMTRAAVKFVSLEPLLGPVDLTPYLLWLDWVIVGGESGPGARPFDYRWAQSIVEQCRDAQVPCFVKQVGARPQLTQADGDIRPLFLLDRRHGGDPSEWPEVLRVREVPKVAGRTR